jgi:hypothetical protein
MTGILAAESAAPETQAVRKIMASTANIFLTLRPLSYKRQLAGLYLARITALSGV